MYGRAFRSSRKNLRDVICSADLFLYFLTIERKTAVNNETNEKTALKVSNVSIAANVFLSVFKLIAGIAANSAAMVSDAVHSASDVFSTIIVIIGFRLSSKKADKEHPYGHERLECVASIILAVILFFTGAEIGKSAISVLLSGRTAEIKIPGMLALAASVISIVVKELMYRYTIYYAKKINSSALKADAWHHRSDSLSSIGAMIGIAGARMGYPVLEPIACLAICLFIFKAAIEIFRDSIDKMVDKSCGEDIEAQMKNKIESESGVKSLVSLHTRMFGSRVYVDTEISVDGSLPLKDAHEIAQRVHDDIEGNFPEVKHCMVHVDPADEKEQK